MLKINALVYTEVELVLDCYYQLSKHSTSKRKKYKEKFITICIYVNVHHKTLHKQHSLVFCPLKTKSQKLKNIEGGASIHTFSYKSFTSLVSSLIITELLNSFILILNRKTFGHIQCINKPKCHTNSLDKYLYHSS